MRGTIVAPCSAQQQGTVQSTMNRASPRSVQDGRPAWALWSPSSNILDHDHGGLALGGPSWPSGWHKGHSTSAFLANFLLWARLTYALPCQLLAAGWPHAYQMPCVVSPGLEEVGSGRGVAEK